MDESFRVNDVEIFNAVQPRMMLPVGQLMLFSTPWAESGLFYDLYKANHPTVGGRPSSALAALATTPAMRSEPGRAQSGGQGAGDRQAARHEQRPARVLLQVPLDQRRPFFAPKTSPTPPSLPWRAAHRAPMGAHVGAGGDVGLVKNSSSHRRRAAGRQPAGRPCLKSCIPDQGKALRPSEVWELFARRSGPGERGRWPRPGRARERPGRPGQGRAHGYQRCPVDGVHDRVTHRAPGAEDQDGRRPAFEGAAPLDPHPAPSGRWRVAGGADHPDGRHCDRAVALATAVFEAWHRGAEVRPQAGV